MGVSVALIVLASHLWLVARYGSDQPFHDQWGAEGFMLYRPWVHGVLTPEYFFFPHSEHRPAATRLLALAEFALNGQWDARVQLLANAGLAAAFAALACIVGWRCLHPMWHPVVAAFAAVWFSLPSNWENTLWAFQSQFYFLLLFGLLHVWGSCASRRLGPVWWLGQFAGLAGLFSIAAGVASAAALVALTLLEWMRGRRDTWTVGTGLANASLVAFAAWLLPPAASMTAAHAKSLPTFLLSYTYLLAWPVHSLIGLVLTMPWLVFLFLAIRRGLTRSADALLIALGAWGWLMLAVLAYGRGDVPGRIAIRYYDVIAVLVFVNGVALAQLVGRSSGRRWPRFVAVGWSGLLVFGAIDSNRWPQLTEAWARFRGYFDQQQEAVREFLRSDDPDALRRNPAVRAYLPHFDFTVELLRDPLLRQRLPPSLVPPLPMRRDADATRGFDEAADASVSSGKGTRQMEQRYQSEPLWEHRLPLLQFRVRGPLGTGASELFVQDRSGRLHRPLGEPERVIDPAQWRTVHIRAPSGPIRIVAVTPPGAPPVAFAPPIEIGWLSWLAPKIAGAWAYIGLAGSICLGAGMAASWRTQTVDSLSERET